MPNHVVNEIIFRGVDAAAQEAILSRCINAEGKVDFEMLVPTPINLWLGNVGQKHEKAFGTTALDWSRTHWGTKWNAYGHKPTERTADTLILRFETAWSPPYPWIIAVFNTFKRSFEHNWLDEGRDRGVAGRWDYAALTGNDAFAEPWTEKPADDELQKHLHTLHYGEDAS